MTPIATELRSALEEAGYEVRDVAENRGTVTATLATTDPPAPELRSLAAEAAGDRLLGVDVSTEHTGSDAVGTVLSVRYR